MKSRSNRHPTSDPPDDWVDESWTVDCICGVNFDDGEEMVNCDECAVWVHTRCVRFVKGEKSFACDKCKSKASRINNDSEETEVAQLLVELPTKTIKMSSGNNNVYSTSNSYAFNNHPPPPPPPRRPPYRLWAHRPMEERVHVQGVPGGADDPSLFQGFPILFGPELWKCSGYVPKKFNFRYREFPCWEKDQDDGDDEAKADGSPENVIDKGAGVLYSLSKENVVVSMRGGQSKGGSSERKGPKERKWENSDSKKISFPGLSKKEKGSGRSIVLHCSNKKNREDLGSSKDRGGKKKSRASHKEQDGKKSKVQGFKAVVIHSTSARQAEVCESKAHKVASIANLSEGSNVEKPKRNAATDEGNLVHRSSEVSGLGCSSDKSVKAEKPGHAATDSSQKSAKTEAVPVLVVEKDNNTINSIKKEGLVLDAMDKNQGVLPVVPEDRTNEFLKPTTPAENVDNAGPEVNSTEVAKEVEATVSLTSGHCVGKTESDSDGVLRSHPPDIDVELHCSEQISSPDRECEDFKQNEAVASSQLRGHEVQDNDKVLEAVSGNQLVKDEELMENQCNNNLKCEGSENSIEVQRTLSDSKEITRVAGEIPKSSGEVLPLPPSYHTIVSTGKSSPSSSTIVISRSCLSDKNRAGSSLKHNSTGKRLVSNFSVPKKENALLGQAKDEDKFEKTKGMLKDHSKSSTNAGSMASQTSKPLMTPSLKHHISLGKDPSRHSSSKKSSTDGAVLPSNINESAGTQQTQHAPTGQSKNTVSAGQHKGEKVQPNLQSSSKSTQSSLGHLPPSSCAPAGLSDEELALLLHQELNSSPRVPRVPRVRNAGSLPQLSSASAASIFNKRSASSGGKDQQTFSRRKNKDGSRNSRELDNEARKVDRAPSSPDSVKTSDALTQAECESIHSVRKNVEDVSTSAANSGPSSTDAIERKSSSTRDSPVNKPEDDTGTDKGLAPIHRTLPGLIAEIMGAGRRMTYEELCNAVLPHWQNLRKHNGERYAYSSHSQAVLDCLRNRSEWSRLVDRGPKTSASRKKRKVDVEPPNTESEDGEDRTFRNGKSKSFDSNKDEFPKGRRKARKRRRLALRGRGVKDDRKRTKKGAGSNDSGTFSNSSEDSGSSDDSQGSGRAAKSEVSASSADIAAP